MSSKIKKKPKRVGYTKKEIHGMQNYGKGQAKVDSMLKEVFVHLQFIGYMALRDRYGFGKTRLLRYWENIEDVFRKYSEKKLGSKELMTYCEVKGIDAYAWMRSIGQSDKLTLANYKKNHQGTLDTIRVIDSAILLYGVVSAVVLKEIFGFSANKITEFYGHLSYYIDSYIKGYLNDSMINGILIDECGLDMLKGEVS